MNMKGSITNILFGAALFIFAVATMAAADTVGVKANVPFGFVAAGQTFAPGNYVFRVDDPLEPSVLIVQHEGGGRAKVALTESDNKPSPANDSKIIFDKFHGKYYLAEVWMEGMDEGRLVPESAIRSEESRVQSAITVRGNE